MKYGYMDIGNRGYHDGVHIWGKYCASGCIAVSRKVAIEIVSAKEEQLRIHINGIERKLKQLMEEGV